MGAFYQGDYLGAVVADIGAYSTKIGWAGDDYPRSYFRSNVAVLREEPSGEDSARRRPISKVNYDYFTRAIQPDGTDGNWRVCNPIDATTGLMYDPGTHAQEDVSHNNNNNSHNANAQDGADWYDLLQIFLRHGYSSALQTSPENHPLLLLERAYNPPPICQQTIECLFEDLQVPAAFLSKDAVTSCYACGRVTATVVDMGYSGITVSPVHEGYVERKGLQWNPSGVAAMDQWLLEQLDALNRQKGPIMPLYQVRRPQRNERRQDIHRAARLYLAQECRELGVGAAINTAAGTSNFQAPHKSFELPDGTMLDVPSATRFAVADLMFGSDVDSVKRRENILSETKEHVSSYIRAIPAHVEGEENDDDEGKFSEAAAVGIAKRKAKRNALSTAATTQPIRKSGFSNTVLQRACSTYLQNHLEHLTSSPIASMVCDATYRCDRDQQAALLGTVIVGGGGSCLGPTEQAVPDLIREQMEAIIHQHTPGWRVKVLTPGFQERSVLSWLGGSILGSLGTFHEMWITKAEYEEWGSAIVNRKCP